MEITHDELIKHGFVPVPNRPTRYGYKHFTARLDPSAFYFHGFNPPLTKLKDLEYMLLLINYHEQSTTMPYPSHMN